MTQPFTIESDGDENEQRSWRYWASERFPSYEAFWVPRVVPLTNRIKSRSDVTFRTTNELEKDGYTDEDVAVAQLHFTLLGHLDRVFELLDDAHAVSERGHVVGRKFGRDEFFESFARLSGASDVADELLARRETPGKYDAWNEMHGSAARRTWRDTHPDPLRPVRAYRNRLVHGRVVPQLFVPAHDATGRKLDDLLFYPRLGTIDRYLDWRVAFATTADEQKQDFDEAALIAVDAWENVVAYVEEAWQTHLLPNI